MGSDLGLGRWASWAVHGIGAWVVHGWWCLASWCITIGGSNLEVYVSLNSVCECVLFSRFSPEFSTRKIPSFVGLRTFAFIEGEKIKCEVILL